MACRVLEVTLISAKDLKKVTVFSKMRVYAVVSISGGDPWVPTHRTHADREGGRSPMWNAPLRFPIPVAADPRGLALHVLLRAERAFGDRDVGEVFVPVQDLLAAAPDDGEHRHLSYQVRRPYSGRKCGVIHISYQITDAVAAPEAAAAAASFPHYMHDAAPRHYAKGVHAVTAYPAAAAARGGGAGGAAYPPYHHGAMHYGSPYRGSYAAHHHHPPYGYGAVGPSYGYGGAPHAAAYGYGAPAPAAAGHGGGMGMGAGLGIGILGGAVGGMMLGDMLADAETDSSFDAGFADGMGF